MYYKKFREHDISTLGLGCLRFPTVGDDPNHIDRNAAREMIDMAIKSGINYFDTAYTYQNGDSERVMGEILSEYPRDSYYLATKFYVDANDNIEEVFEEQLRRLQTDYIDFYMLHSVDENFIAAYTDPEKDYLGYLLKQKEAGRIKYIGFSSHATPEALTKFLDWYDKFDMALIQLNYLDWTLLKAKEQYEILTERGIPVWVMEPLKGGRMATLNEKAASILKEAAPERSIASWGFRFLMGLPNVQTVLSGMSAPDQLEDNLRTFSKPDPLNEAEKEALQKAIDSFMDDLGVPCSACRYCCKTCPAGLDIPLLIQAYNECRMDGQLWKLAALVNSKGPEECLNCGICKKYCPQKIDIPGVMKALIELDWKKTL